MVGGMIRRTVRQRFHTVFWKPPVGPLPEAPVIFCANHHGWHDGYLMFHLITRLGYRSLDWIQEYHAFPLFRTVGGMPFPSDDPAVRAKTLRTTVRLMKEEKRSLVLFPEGVLHRPSDILPLGKSLQWVSQKVPSAVILPVGIVYAMHEHERPMAYLALGEPRPGPVEDLEAVRQEMTWLLDRMQTEIAQPGVYSTLVEGTKDVNERWGRKKRP